MRQLFLFTLALLPALCFAQKGKKTDKKNPDKVERQALIEKAESAVTAGSLDTAAAAYSKALWMWYDIGLRRKLADVHLLRGDTAKCCEYLPINGDAYRADKSFYEAHCVREDSVPFADTDLDPVTFPDHIRAKRTWYRAPNETWYKLYGPDGKSHLNLKITPTDTVFAVTDEMPAFAEGEPALFKYLGANIRYPDEAMSHNFQGVVYVTFVVGKDGSIQNAKILRGVHYSMDAESLRVVRNMPKWKPGTYNGSPVRTAYNLPIRYTLR